MSLTFLAPLFLAGLAALAVPVIIHLTRRQKKQVVEFPSLMFLRQIPYQSVRRRWIRNWPLFLLRCVAIVILAAAFARPFLDRPGRVTAPLASAREVVILLDRSYSMAYGDRWTRALAAARETVEGLGPEDRVSLVFFAAGAAVAHPPTADRARLRAALDTVRVGSGTTRYGPALKLAQSTLEGSELPRREVVLITDFQRVGWEGEEGVRLPAGTVLTPVAINDPAPANLSVTSVTFRRELFAGRERVSASARLTNKGERAFRDLPVALELDGREAQSRTVSLEPNSSATVTFAPFTLGEQSLQGAVRAGEDALPLDNAFYFVLSPDQAVRVLLLGSGSAGAESSLYLRRALAIGDQPPFRVEAKSAAQLRPADLAGRSVVILNDAAFPGGEVGRRLKSFVESGGGLVVALGERSSPRDWQREGGDLLPASFDRPVDRSQAGGAALAYLDYSHPVFELFNAPRSGDFAAARFFRYRPLALSGSEGVLARFSDGSVALAEKRVGHGRVLVWASTLDSFWNDLALQPVFLPFVHQLVKYAGGYSQAAPWYTVGDLLDLERRAAVGISRGETAPPAGAADATLIARSPSGAQVALQEGTGVLALEEQGFYLLSEPRGEARAEVVAVNLDLAESNLSTLDPAELASLVAPRGGGDEQAHAAALLTPEERERRQAMWWYLLVGVFLLLAAETVLSNRLSRTARGTV